MRASASGGCGSEVSSVPGHRRCSLAFGPETAFGLKRPMQTAERLQICPNTLMKMKRKYFSWLLSLVIVAAMSGCGVAIKYSLSGASIPPDARTFSVAYFPNNATMVSPILSSTLTDALVDIFSRRTRLMQVDEGGDFAFEGEITNYTSVTASVSSNDYALLNRLTITIKVRFTNALDESQSWNKTFSAYEDYDSSLLLTEAEGSLIPEIVDKLVTDIFMASASNW